MKKICFLLSVLLCIVPFSVGAETQSGSCGDGVSWKFDAVNGTLNISGNGSMTDFADTSSRPWDEFSGSVTKVIVENGITHIGKNSFRRMLSLLNVSLPDGLLSIGDKAFAYDDGISYLNIPDTVTDIGESAFYFCKNLAEILLPSGLVSVSDNCFFACGGIEYISIPDKVTSVGKNAFYFCSSLESVRFPKSIKNVNTSAFDKCGSLSVISYDGALSEWSKVSILSGNESLSKGTLYFVSSVKGDVDCNGVTNDEDAIYLLYHIFFPSSYPCPANADFDKSGELDQDDAMYLLYHIFFPDVYLL